MGVGAPQPRLSSTLQQLSKMPSSIGLSPTTVDLWDRFASYDIVVRFSTLRIVGTIAGNNFRIAYDCRDPFDNPLPSKSSNVESFVFNRSNVDSKWLTQYLGSLKSTRVSRCSGTSQDRWQPSFDPCRIRAALLAHAKESLEVLQLNSGRGKGRYIGSLSQFEALRELHTSQHRVARPHANELAQEASRHAISLTREFNHELPGSL